MAFADTRSDQIHFTRPSPRRRQSETPPLTSCRLVNAQAVGVVSLVVATARPDSWSLAMDAAEAW